MKPSLQISKYLIFAFIFMLTISAAAETKNNASANPKSKPAEGTLYNETCVIYDFRPMIADGEQTELFFAIEPQNHNGGSLEKIYTKKKYKNSKAAYKAMLKGLIEFSEQNRCEDFRFFYPSKNEPEAPL